MDGSATMKLVIFGGTGGTGALIVRETLAAAHDVTGSRVR
jgi:hypothetical protein